MPAQKWRIVLESTEKLSEYDRRKLEKMGLVVRDVVEVKPPTVKITKNTPALEAEFLRLRAALPTMKRGDGQWERFLEVGTELCKRAKAQRKGQTSLDF